MKTSMVHSGVSKIYSIYSNHMLVYMTHLHPRRNPINFFVLNLYQSFLYHVRGLLMMDTAGMMKIWMSTYLLRVILTILYRCCYLKVKDEIDTFLLINLKLLVAFAFSWLKFLICRFYLVLYKYLRQSLLC